MTTPRWINSPNLTAAARRAALQDEDADRFPGDYLDKSLSGPHARSCNDELCTGECEDDPYDDYDVEEDFDD